MSFALGWLPGTGSIPLSYDRRLQSLCIVEPSTPDLGSTGLLRPGLSTFLRDDPVIDEQVSIPTSWERLPGPQLNPAPIKGTGWPAHSIFAKQVSYTVIS